jgi:N-acetylglucosaminyl-diphospho-decaprenol L-rhamnosyltransferase
MKTTIIIVTFKSEKIIYQCLSSINNNYPVIVIENSNNELFKNEIEKKFSNTKCILTGENLGFGKANNIGLRLAKTDYVFLLNPDTVLFEDTLEVLESNADYIKNFALLAPIITDSNELNYGFFNKKKISTKNISAFEVDYIKGFAMFFNKNKFSQIDYFDENIFLYLEEIDLCKRLNFLNEKIYLIYNAKIKHLGGKSHGEKFNLEIEISRNWHWMWSKFYFTKKHFGVLKAYNATILFFFKSILKMIFFLFFNKQKFLINKARFLGLLNSYLGKKSFYRPFNG